MLSTYSPTSLEHAAFLLLLVSEIQGLTFASGHAPLPHPTLGLLQDLRCHSSFRVLTPPLPLNYGLVGKFRWPDSPEKRRV